MLAVKEVNYDTGHTRYLSILSGVSLNIRKGENTVIYGKNGSGKTTLMRIMLGFTKPSSGTVIGGKERASAVFENPDDQIFFSSVREELYSLKSRDENIINMLSLSDIWERSTMELSYSEKVRLVFCVAYHSDKSFLLVDSPPVDDRVDEALGFIAEENLKTVVLFLPEGDSRKYPGIWKKYLLENGKLTEFKD